MRSHRRHERVEQDLRKAASWYEAAVVGLGSEFVDAVEAAIEVILKDPLHWSLAPTAPVGIPVRRFVLERFPYYIPYLVDRDDLVVVLAIAHGRRRPGFWLRRVPGTRRRR